MNNDLWSMIVDLELDFLTEVIGLDSLHFGIWEDHEPESLEYLDRAQNRYTQKLASFIPEEVEAILDVGSGMGDNARYLTGKGYRVTAISPTESHRRFYEDGLAGLEFHCTGIEDFTSDCTYDLILMSESSNYFSYQEAFEKFETLLKPGGYVLVSGLFKKKETELFQRKHRYDEYLAWAQGSGYEILDDEDITQSVLKTLTVGRNGLIYVQKTLTLLDRYSDRFKSSVRGMLVFNIGKLLAGNSPEMIFKALDDLLYLYDEDMFQEYITYRIILFRKNHL